MAGADFAHSSRESNTAAIYKVHGGSLNQCEPAKIVQAAENLIYKAFIGAVFSRLRKSRFVYTEDVGSSSLSRPTIIIRHFRDFCKVFMGSLNPNTAQPSHAEVQNIRGV